MQQLIKTNSEDKLCTHTQRCQFILMLGIKYQFLLYDFESQNKIKRNKIGKKEVKASRSDPYEINSHFGVVCRFA